MLQLLQKLWKYLTEVPEIEMCRLEREFRALRDKHDHEMYAFNAKDWEEGQPLIYEPPAEQSERIEELTRRLSKLQQF